MSSELSRLANDSNTKRSRKRRKAMVLHHLGSLWRGGERGWEEAAESTRRGRWLQSSAARPLCALVSNAASLCRTLPLPSLWWGTLGSLGCRCPFSLDKYNSIMVGTHHKTGTVLMEKASTRPPSALPVFPPLPCSSFLSPSLTPPSPPLPSDRSPLSLPCLIFPRRASSPFESFPTHPSHPLPSLPSHSTPSRLSFSTLHLLPFALSSPS